MPSQHDSYASGEVVGKIRIAFEAAGDGGNTFVTVVPVIDNGRPFEEYAFQAANGLSRSLRENYADRDDVPASAMAKAKEYVASRGAADAIAG